MWKEGLNGLLCPYHVVPAPLHEGFLIERSYFWLVTTGHESARGKLVLLLKAIHISVNAVSPLPLYFLHQRSHRLTQFQGEWKKIPLFNQRSIKETVAIITSHKSEVFSYSIHHLYLWFKKIKALSQNLKSEWLYFHKKISVIANIINKNECILLHFLILKHSL